MDFDAVVIGSGFGGSVAASQLAAREKEGLVLGRGAGGGTPEKVGKAQPLAAGKQRMPDWLAANKQPVQYWPRPDNKDGLLDVFASIRTGLHRDGLYKFSNFDDATTLTASAVGGGSMIYSNVTIEPDPRLLAHTQLHLSP